MAYLCVQFLPLSPVHADDNKKFSYCGGNIKFSIPPFFDRTSVEKQSGVYTCKNGLILKGKVGNKSTYINFIGDYLGVNEANSDEYLAQFKKNYPERLHYVFSYKTLNGTSTIITFYWLDKDGNLKQIEKRLFFAKKDSMSATAAYSANPNDANDILFMNALEQMFLSAEIDW